MAAGCKNLHGESVSPLVLARLQVPQPTQPTRGSIRLVIAQLLQLVICTFDFELCTFPRSRFDHGLNLLELGIEVALPPMIRIFCNAPKQVQTLSPFLLIRSKQGAKVLMKVLGKVKHAKQMSCALQPTTINLTVTYCAIHAQATIGKESRWWTTEAVRQAIERPSKGVHVLMHDEDDS